MKKLKITQVNTRVDVGGAAKFIMRLADIQRKIGHDAQVLAANPVPNGDHIHGFDPSPIQELSQQCKASGQLYYEFQGSHRLIDNALIQSSDIIHCSNLHGSYFNPWSISAISHAKPVVWTLHDMQSITGYCAHSLDCTKWQSGCGGCPNLNIYPKLAMDNTAQLIRDKRYIYENSFLQIVTPADWLRKKVQNSILRNHPVELIYNGCDTDIFKPYPKAQVRQKFGIPQDVFVIGAVAQHGVLVDPWKGGKYTQAAWEAIKKLIPNSVFLQIGAKTQSKDPSILNVPPVQDETHLAQLYNLLDVFLYTSIADTCPLVVIETLACGVPIVTFDTGGIPELVRDKMDGFVFAKGDVEGLICAVMALHDNKQLAQMMGQYARKSAVERFSMEDTTRRYIDLYYQCIERHKIQTRQPKYFDMNRVPEIVKTPDFLAAEKHKGQIVASSENDQPVPTRPERSPASNPFDHFTYSKLSHFAYFKSQKYDLEYLGKEIHPETCNLKDYQDLLVFAFIKENLPKGSKILDVGGADSRILKHFHKDYECWNIDKLEGVGNGCKSLDPAGRYRLVRDYMGNFNPELPDNYFDFVFSISALEHVPQDNPELFKNVRDDLNRVLKPGGCSLHCFDIVITPDSVWTNPLLPFLFQTQPTLNRFIPLESLRSDPDLYVLTEAAYNQRWKKTTQQSYQDFGKPLSYNILWQKTPVISRKAPAVPATASNSVNTYPKITLVIPSYNQAAYLEQCIQSVLTQNYPNLELIIMDGGSVDGSVEIIKKYQSYLAYWQTCPDGGQYRAVEAGFKRSTGQIMTWLNSDDILRPGALYRVAAVFLSRPEIQWLTGRPNTIHADGTERTVRENLPVWTRLQYLQKQYKKPYIQQEGTFWTRALWEKAGAYMHPTHQMAGDLELWARFFRYAQLHTVDTLLGSFRHQPEQKTKKVIEQYYAEAEQTLDYEILFYNQSPDKTLFPGPSPIGLDELNRLMSAFTAFVGEHVNIQENRNLELCCG